MAIRRNISNIWQIITWKKLTINFEIQLAVPDKRKGQISANIQTPASHETSKFSDELEPSMNGDMTWEKKETANCHILR